MLDIGYVEISELTAWDYFVEIVDPILSLASLIAIVAGGLWVYFHYFKGRTYRPRLKTSVFGSVFKIDSRSFLVATIEVTNMGLSNVRITQKGTGLRVSVCKENHQKLEPEKTVLKVFSILQDHRWIEPAESLEEEVLVCLKDDDFVAVYVELRVVSESALEWNSSSYISPSLETV